MSASTAGLSAALAVPDLPMSLILLICERLHAPDVGNLVQSHPVQFCLLRGAVKWVQLSPGSGDDEGNAAAAAAGSTGEHLTAHTLFSAGAFLRRLRRLAERRLFPNLKEVRNRKSVTACSCIDMPAQHSLPIMQFCITQARKHNTYLVLAGSVSPRAQARLRSRP